MKSPNISIMTVLIKVIYGVTKKKQDCVFGDVHLVAVSISNVGAALWNKGCSPGIKQAWLANGSPFSQTIFYLKYGNLKDTLFWV